MTVKGSAKSNFQIATRLESWECGSGLCCLGASSPSAALLAKVRRSRSGFLKLITKTERLAAVVARGGSVAGGPCATLDLVLVRHGRRRRPKWPDVCPHQRGTPFTEPSLRCPRPPPRNQAPTSSGAR